MEKLIITPRVLGDAHPSRVSRQQLKVLMNLPVRLISGEEVIDVLPLPEDEVPSTRYLTPCIGKLLNPPEKTIFPTPDELIEFFQGLHPGDLLTNQEVALMYRTSLRTISRLANRGYLKRYRIAANLSLYKRSELRFIPPIIEQQVA